MSIVVGDNFDYKAGKPLDGRVIYATLADMKAVADATMYNGCMAYCVGTDKTYQWKSSNTVDPDTGRWREFSSGGGSSVSPYTSNPAMNGTASPGSSDNYARGDHVHPSDTAKLGTSGDGSNVTAAFTAASSRANISTGEKLSVIFGKIAKFFADLKTVAFSGSYNDLSNKLTAGTNIAISNANVISTTSTYTTRFSTSEQVVGTWIDGSNIYQKTLALGTLPSSGTGVETLVSVGANVKMYIRAELVTADGTWDFGNASYYETDGLTICNSLYTNSSNNPVNKRNKAGVITTGNWSWYGTPYFTVWYVKV